MSDVVRIRCRDGHEHPVPAHIHGQWAATRAIDEVCDFAPHWTVTMVPSGRCIQRHIGRPNEAQANMLASRIAYSVPTVADWTTIESGGSFAEAVLETVRAVIASAEYIEASAPTDWSVRLRAKVAAGVAADMERTRITIDQEDF